MLSGPAALAGSLSVLLFMLRDGVLIEALGYLYVAVAFSMYGVVTSYVNDCVPADERIAVSAGLLLISLVDVYWLVVPAFLPKAPRIHPSDLLAVIAIGGIWVWSFAVQLRGKPLLPLGDARMEEAPEHGH